MKYLPNEPKPLLRGWKLSYYNCILGTSIKFITHLQDVLTLYCFHSFYYEEESPKDFCRLMFPICNIFYSFEGLRSYHLIVPLETLLFFNPSPSQLFDIWSPSCPSDVLPLHIFKEAFPGLSPAVTAIIRSSLVPATFKHVSYRTTAEQLPHCGTNKGFLIRRSWIITDPFPKSLSLQKPSIVRFLCF